MFVELPPEDYQPGDEHMCGLLQYSLYGTRDAAQNWEEELTSRLTDLKIDERGARARACGKAASRATTLWTKTTTSKSAENGRWWNSSSKCCQEIGEDPGFEKSGRILSRFIELDRDGITIEADQRRVRETLKDFELQRANHSATPCAVERKDESGARGDESKGESRCGQGQTQIKHERVDVNDGDDRDRLHVADDDANDSQALTSGDITQYRALVARISYMSQDRPDLKFARPTSDGKTISTRRGSCLEDRKILRWEAESRVLVLLAAEWRPGSAFRR